MSISCTQYCFPDQLCLWLRLWGSPTIFLASSPFFSCKPPPSCLPWALQSFFLPLFISPSMIKAFSLCILDDLIDESQRGGRACRQFLPASPFCQPCTCIAKGICKVFLFCIRNVTFVVSCDHSADKYAKYAKYAKRTCLQQHTTHGN